MCLALVFTYKRSGRKYRISSLYRKNTEITDTECEVSEEKTAEAADIYEEKYAVLSEEIVEKAHQKLDI